VATGSARERAGGGDAAAVERREVWS
jgi:hypothetical protein